MNITVNGKTIETDRAGFLKNPYDWNDEVGDMLVKEYEKSGLRPIDDTSLGLVDYFREYYEENHTHPTMNVLVNTLGKHQKKHFSDTYAYKKFLYELFPNGPVQTLCQLAGLPDPGVENQS